MKFVIQGLKYDTDMKPIAHLLRQFTEIEK